MSLIVHGFVVKVFPVRVVGINGKENVFLGKLREISARVIVKVEFLHGINS